MEEDEKASQDVGKDTRPMRVLVCGDRSWTDRERVEARLSQLPTHSMILHGGCRGADAIAGDVGELIRYLASLV